MDKDYTRDNHEKTLRRKAQADVTRVSTPAQDKRTTATNKDSTELGKRKALPKLRKL